MRGLWAGALLLGLIAAVPARAEGVRWGALRLEASAPFDTAAWESVRELEGREVENAPLDPVLWRGIREMARRGFPFASVEPLRFDLEDGRLTGALRIDPGQKALLEAITLDGARVTRAGTALRLSGFSRGALYTGQDNDRVRERLARSGLFASVGDVHVAAGTDSGSIVLRVPVTEPAYTRFAAVLGAGGKASGLTGLLDLALQNVAGTAREFGLRWEDRGTGLNRYRLRYREPWLPVVPLGVTGSLNHDVNRDLYSYTLWEITGDLQVLRGWTVEFGRGASRAVQTGRGRTEESFFTVGITLDRRDSALDPTAGYRLAGRSRRGTKTEEITADSLQLRVDRTRWDAEADGYRRVGPRWLAVARLRFQFLDTPEDSVPRWDLIPVGGALSLRGYREEQFLTTGALTLQTEWRWLQGDAGSAYYVFVDTGLLARETGSGSGSHFDEFLLGTGVGIRQATRAGVLGVEYGVARGEGPLDGRIHLRLDAAF